MNWLQVLGPPLLMALGGLIIWFIKSQKYGKAAFDLTLFGSDDVVQAYNALMAHTYKAEETGERDPKELMRLWGVLLLEIRRSPGNKSTKLGEFDMLRGIITDIDSFS